MNEITLEKKSKVSNKYSLLFAGILFDLIGMLSFTIPLIGEFTDVVWAPIAAVLLKTLYKGKVGTIGSIIAFVEEALPGLDFIPTFTLTWVYTYLIKRK